MVMIKVNVFEAKARLSEYLDRAAGGERILICRRNEPVAELRAVASTRTEPRPIGPLPGRPRFSVPATFFEPLPVEELDAWEGGGERSSLDAPRPARSARRSRTRRPRR
jgi:prevent-host-death family protein